MGVYGDHVASTPNLDRLAGESVRFNEVYCTNPICAPSRASMMTGLYTHQLGAHGNDQPYAPAFKTMPGIFGRAGYFTALIGKMHAVDAQLHGFDYELEFNEWFQTLGPKTGLYADELGSPNSGAGLPQVTGLWDKGDPWKGHRKPDGRLGLVAVGTPSLMAEEDHFETFVADQTVKFLESYAQSDQPFFLVSSFLKPHDPFMPAQRFADMYKPDDIKLSPTWGKADLDNVPRRVRKAIETCHFTPELKQASEARKRTAYYYGNLAQMDDGAGKVLRALTRLGLDKNTIVVYTADHGEMLGDLGLWNKFQFYEGSCAVPFLVRMPGIAPGQNDVPLSLVSLSATLADLSDIPTAGPTDGRSFASLVRDPQSHFDNGPVFAEFSLGNSGAKYMIRRGEWKYTYWVDDTPELYSLSSDPEELHNLASDAHHAATVKDLHNELFAWHAPRAWKGNASKAASEDGEQPHI